MSVLLCLMELLAFSGERWEYQCWGAGESNAERVKERKDRERVRWLINSFHYFLAAPEYSRFIDLLFFIFPVLSLSLSVFSSRCLTFVFLSFYPFSFILMLYKYFFTSLYYHCDEPSLCIHLLAVQYM